MSIFTGSTVVPAVISILIALAIALTMGGTFKNLPYEYTLARICYALAFLILLFRAGYWLAFQWPEGKLLSLLVAAIIFGSVGALWVASTMWVTEREQRHRVTVSPSKVVLHDPTNKNFVLTITNNQSTAIYNVNLGVCVDYRPCDFSSIKIEPAGKEKEFMPGIPVSIFRVGISNGCFGLVFAGIGPQETKKFFVTIEGQKLKANAQIAFTVYNWYSEPYFESLDADKKYVSKGAPGTFAELFNDKSKASQTGHAYRMKMKMPSNPFFRDKEDTEDYWVVAFTDF